MSDYPDDLLKEARKICSAWLHVDGPYRDALGLVVQGMMAERERCAKMAEDLPKIGENPLLWPSRTAAAIRKGTA